MPQFAIQRAVLIVSSLAAAAAAMLGGCAEQHQNPMRSSLVDLTGESRTIPVQDPTSKHFTLAEHRQSLSIGGLLNIPDIGQQVHFMGGDDVTTTTGVAVVQSYRLIGESESPDSWSSAGARVSRVREALERSQTLAVELSVLTVEIADLRAKLDANLARAIEENDKDEKRRRRQKDDTTLKPGVMRETVDALVGRAENELRRELDERIARRDSKEHTLAQANDELRRAANAPGIIVARWKATGKAGATLELNPSTSASFSASEGRSGFVILGGLRVVSLVFGEDFWWLLNNLRPHERPYIETMGITTQLIQARDVAYISDVSIERGARLALDVRKLGGTALDQAKIEAYFSSAAQLTNSGNLARITWRREPFCAVCSVDLPGLARCEHRALQKCFGVECQCVDPHTYDGWRTVAANTLFLKNSLAFNWNKHAAKYAAPREMVSAPSCPFCSSKADPAVVPGRHLPGETCSEKSR